MTALVGSDHCYIVGTGIVVKYNMRSGTGRSGGDSSVKRPLESITVRAARICKRNCISFADGCFILRKAALRRRWIRDFCQRDIIYIEVVGFIDLHAGRAQGRITAEKSNHNSVVAGVRNKVACKLGI